MWRGGLGGREVGEEGKGGREREKRGRGEEGRREEGTGGEGKGWATERKGGEFRVCKKGKKVGKKRLNPPLPSSSLSILIFIFSLFH